MSRSPSALPFRAVPVDCRARWAVWLLAVPLLLWLLGSLSDCAGTGAGTNNFDGSYDGPTSAGGAAGAA